MIAEVFHAESRVGADHSGDRIVLTMEISTAKLLRRALAEMATYSMTSKDRAHRHLVEDCLGRIIGEAEAAALQDGATAEALA